MLATNQNTTSNPVGRFMVAAGAVIELNSTGKILLIRRADNLDWKPGGWEVGYGRIAQFEDPEEGLRRETKEETGITDLQIGQILTVWHIYRGGEQIAENDLIGITYAARTQQEEVKISDEHSEFGWFSPEEALKLVTMPGIQRDIQAWIRATRQI